ncbi:MAG: SOS response-associated peptidase [Parasphingorhabdus sp.]|uniref:SOS response-associated peptidase n=1 Tax=Parasphingorhabdus sp. TaxID=2709688 RepID=UPI003296B243
MCGRKYASEELTWAEYRDILDITGPPRNLQPSYNIAPTQEYYVCTEQDGKRELRPMRWWLVPHWAKELSSKYPSFNAKAETLEQKQSFKGLVKSNRAVVMVSGFYEWKREGSDKQPYRVEHPKGEPMLFPALWTYNKHLDVYSYTIITTAPSEGFKWLHHRQAAILPPEQAGSWLSGPWEQAKRLMAPYEGELNFIPVSKEVGKVQNNYPALLEPVSL